MPASFLFALTVKATLVLAAAWAGARVLRRASAAARGIVWASGLTFALALPASMAVPAWSFELPVPMRIAGAVAPERGLWDPIARRESTLPTLPGRAPEGPGTARAFERVARLLANASPLAFALWAIGGILVLVRLGRGQVSVWRITRGAEPLNHPAWTVALAQACTDLGVHQAPAMRMSDRIALPAIAGVSRPTLLLPSGCLDWTASCRRAVILHELGHLKRRDCLLQLLADCACAMYWFHPLAYLAAARLREERERACDDIVLAAGTCPTTYADHLLDLVTASIRLPPAPAVAFGSRSRLNQRISAILDDEQARTRPCHRTVTASLVVGAVAVACLGGARVVAQSGAVGDAVNRVGGASNVMSRVITPQTRRRVAEALAVGMRDADSSIRDVAIRAVASIEARGEDLVRIETPCRGNCVDWPAATVPDAFERAVDALASTDVETRRDAAGKAWARSERGAAALARALVDEDRIVRNLAAVRLDSVHAPVAVPNWIVLLDDTDPMLRERAAISLGVIGDPRAIDALADALRDPEAPIRLQAARALAAIALGREETMMLEANQAATRPLYAPGNGVTLPEVVTEVRPEYTPAAKEARVMGSVLLEVVVEPDGSVGDVWVARSLDQEYGLDAQATGAAKQWRFKPGSRGGEPVAVVVAIEMQFTMR